MSSQRSLDPSVLTSLRGAVRSFIQSNGSDTEVSGWILGDDFAAVVATLLSSPCDEVRFVRVPPLLWHWHDCTPLSFVFNHVVHSLTGIRLAQSC